MLSGTASAPAYGRAFIPIADVRPRVFTRVAIANRGEIAVRIIRALREMSVTSILLHSSADATSLAASLADERVCIGPPPAAQSYLDIGAVVQGALDAGADGLHPGYGFLSENAAFATAVGDAGITFIGPRPEVIARLGDKVAARRAVVDAGVPVMPGSDGAIEGREEAMEVARSVGLPVIVKAAGGGGGRGMRVVHELSELPEAIERASTEALSAFGNAAVYVERYFERPRHIEVQVLGDLDEVIHLGERECTIQRRHQKLIEESPSPVVDRALRERLCAAAVDVARAVGYTNAGTVEFLLQEGQFHFLEVNTRIQVEHPVTELVTGVDLVCAQLRLAAGEPLTMRQSQIHQRGNAIEVRINAEDPYAQFLPSPGRVRTFVPAQGPGVRVDTAIRSGDPIPREYDSLICKLVVLAPDRLHAIARMRMALHETVISGVPTALDYYHWVLGTEQFRTGAFSTRFVTDHPPVVPPATALASAALAGALRLHRDARAIGAIRGRRRNAGPEDLPERDRRVWRQAGQQPTPAPYPWDRVSPRAGGDHEW